MDLNSRSFGGPVNWRWRVGAPSLVDWNILHRDANLDRNRNLALSQGKINVQYVLGKIVLFE